MLKLFVWEEDYGRMGNLQAVFMAEQAEVEKYYGCEAYLDEPLGKYSEVSVPIDPDTFVVHEIDENTVKVLQNVFGSNHIAGCDLLGSVI